MYGKLPLTLLFACLTFTGGAFAQSHDQNHPTPLGPGVNKGNVDDFGGPHFYYFWAGPGHFEVKMAFHEMGLFGNPYRQSMTFDLFDDKGDRKAHMTVVSQGNTATLTNHGDFTERKRMRLRVAAQDGLIKLGGYYEFEATGAVSFDSKTASGSGAKAELSESLVKNVGPLVKSSGPLVQSSGPLVKSSGAPLVKSSGGPLVKSSGPLVYPGKPLIVQQTAHAVRITLAADVLFDFGKADIRPDAVATLREAAEKIKAAQAHGAILVNGYTDSKGTAALNQRLSQQRAEAVDAWLVKNAGFAASAFTPKGYGAAHPVSPNELGSGADYPEGRQKNRRVEIVVPK